MSKGQRGNCKLANAYECSRLLQWNNVRAWESKTNL